MPIKHEIEYQKTKRTRFRAPGIKVFVILIALAIFGWGFFNLAPLALLALSLLTVVPILSIAGALSCSPESDFRLFLWSAAWLALIVGGPFVWLIKEDFTSLGLEVEKIRRAISVSESTSDPKHAESKFGHASMDHLRRLSVENRRRAAVQLARFGRWSLAHEAWRSTAVGYGTDSELRTSSYLKIVSERGVSKANLLPLCQNIHASGFKAQSVSLWRSYYPNDVPKNWRQPFEEFGP